MPTYLFRNKNTGEEFEEFMGISARDTYLAENTHIEQLVNGAPAIGYNMMTRKPDSAFRDKLKTLKKKHRGSNIETF